MASSRALTGLSFVTIGVVVYSLMSGAVANASPSSAPVPAAMSTAVVTAAAGVDADLPDLESSVPTIDGAAVVGEALTALTGVWTDGTEFAYQWAADGVAIEGATDASLTLAAAQEGARITVEVSGTLEGYTPASQVSEPTERVMLTGTPTMSGKPIVGTSLTAAPGTWTSGTSFAYQWNADDVPVAGATGTKFAVTAAQDGQAITVTVTGTKAEFPTASATSGATKHVMRASTPTISGTKAVGLTLTAVPGTWTDGTTFTYTWRADGKVISGATNRTLKLGTGLKGKRISVEVTGSKADHPTVTRTSTATGRIATAAKPTISGTKATGFTLTAKHGTWTTGTAFRYQWLADGAPISGATKQTFTLTGSQKDKRITVRVTGTKSGYATVERISASTARILLASKPSVSGTAKVTYTLTAKRGAWTTGASFRYQWFANGTAISGATSSTLKLKPGMVGKKITVSVKGTKSGYGTATKKSNATAAVTYPLRTAPVSSWNCPSWAPIKGNADSMIYHMPWNRYYDATKPEDCFRTEQAARDAGYRAAKV